MKQSHPLHEGASGQGARRPYWKHAHRDWRFWGALGLMLAAMTMYVATNDLALRPRRQTAPPSGVIGR
jgi:hypothetical protein